MSHICSAGYGCTCDAVEGYVEELEENEGVISALRRQRDDAERKLIISRQHLEAAIVNVYANVGPSPVLVEIRKAIAILDGEL